MTNRAGRAGTLVRIAMLVTHFSCRSCASGQVSVFFRNITRARRSISALPVLGELCRSFTEIHRLESTALCSSAPTSAASYPRSQHGTVQGQHPCGENVPSATAAAGSKAGNGLGATDSSLAAFILQFRAKSPGSEVHCAHRPHSPTKI